jgi:hypothetical protein
MAQERQEDFPRCAMFFIATVTSLPIIAQVAANKAR